MFDLNRVNQVHDNRIHFQTAFLTGINVGHNDIFLEKPVGYFMKNIK